MRSTARRILPTWVLSLKSVETSLNVRSLAAGPSQNLAVRLHPAIYETIAGRALLFVIGAWGFFASNDTYYLLEIVTGFVCAAVLLLFQLWRVRRHGHDPRVASLSHHSFPNWLDAELDIWQGRPCGLLDAATTQPSARTAGP